MRGNQYSKTMKIHLDADEGTTAPSVTRRIVRAREPLGTLATEVNTPEKRSNKTRLKITPPPKKQKNTKRKRVNKSCTDENTIVVTTQKKVEASCRDRVGGDTLEVASGTTHKKGNVRVRHDHKRFRACARTHLVERSPKQEKNIDQIFDTRYGTCDIQ